MGAAWVLGEVLGRVGTQGPAASPAQPGPEILSSPNPIPYRGRAASAGFPSPRASHDLARIPASLSHRAPQPPDSPAMGFTPSPPDPSRPPASKPHWKRSRPFLAPPGSSQHTAHMGPTQRHTRIHTLTPAPELTILCRASEAGASSAATPESPATVSPRPPLTTPPGTRPSPTPRPCWRDGHPGPGASGPASAPGAGAGLGAPAHISSARETEATQPYYPDEDAEAGKLPGAGSHLGFLWPISRSKFLLLTTSDLHSVSVLSRGNKAETMGNLRFEACQPHVLRSKPVTTRGPMGQLLEPRWTDRGAGLRGPARQEPDAG